MVTASKHSWAEPSNPYISANVSSLELDRLQIYIFTLRKNLTARKGVRVLSEYIYLNYNIQNK